MSASVMVSGRGAATPDASSAFEPLPTSSGLGTLNGFPGRPVLTFRTLPMASGPIGSQPPYHITPIVRAATTRTNARNRHMGHLVGWYLVPGVRCLVSGVWCLVPGRACDQLPGTRHQAP